MIACHFGHLALGTARYEPKTSRSDGCHNGQHFRHGQDCATENRCNGRVGRKSTDIWAMLVIFEALKRTADIANVYTHPMSKLLCRSSPLRTAMHLFHRQLLVVRHVQFPVHVGVNFCFERAANHLLRIQRSIPCQSLTKPNSRSTSC